MPKQTFIGDDDKKDIKQILIDNKQIIQDNLKLVANGGNWPDLSGLPQVGQDALEIVRQNQIIFANALFYLYKRTNELERRIAEF